MYNKKILIISSFLKEINDLVGCWRVWHIHLHFGDLVEGFLASTDRPRLNPTANTTAPQQIWAKYLCSFINTLLSCYSVLTAQLHLLLLLLALHFRFIFRPLQDLFLAFGALAYTYNWAHETSHSWLFRLLPFPCDCDALRKKASLRKLKIKRKISCKASATLLECHPLQCITNAAAYPTPSHTYRPSQWWSHWSK